MTARALPGPHQRLMGVLSALLLSVLAITLGGCEEKLTDANFDKITVGMTKYQVEKLLGGKGEEQVVSGTSIGFGGVASSSSSANTRQATYIWRESGKEVSVTFQDGKVVNKGKSF